MTLKNVERLRSRIESNLEEYRSSWKETLYTLDCILDISLLISCTVCSDCEEGFESVGMPSDEVMVNLLVNENRAPSCKKR